MQKGICVFASLACIVGIFALIYSTFINVELEREYPSVTMDKFIVSKKPKLRREK